MDHIRSHHRQHEDPVGLQPAEGALFFIQVCQRRACQDGDDGVDVEDEISALLVLQQLSVEQGAGSMAPPSDPGLAELFLFAQPLDIALPAALQDFLVVLRELHGVLVESPLAVHPPCRRHYGG